MSIVPPVIQLGAIGIEVVVTRLDDLTFGESQVHPHALIAIDERLGDQQAAMTLIHELLHVISEHWSLDLSERQVCCLEQALAMTMFHNPELMPNLQKAIGRSRIG